MTAPERPIGVPGRAAWDEWSSRVANPNAELLALAELLDERAILRRDVLRSGTPADRKALRALDALVTEHFDAVRRAAAWHIYATEER
jgi:hypothetical protein